MSGISVSAFSIKISDVGNPVMFFFKTLPTNLGFDEFKEPKPI